jgi:monoamine oxidase
VRRVEQRDGRVTVRADGGRAVVARAAVLTVPPALTGAIAHDPPLPAVRDGLQQRLAMGAVIKLHVVYPEPFWRAEGLSGEAASLDGPVGVVYDNSPPSGSPGVLLAFLEAGHAREWSPRPAAERHAAVVDALVRLFGPRAARPERILERDWTTEPWTRGCYGAFFPPGTWTGYGRALREPVGAVHWAGAETATRHAGYMDGAVRSGEAAARAVLVALR